MKTISEIIKKIDDELCDAKDYAKLASATKGNNDAMFNLAMKLASVELEHATMWHNIAVEEIRKAKDTLAKANKEVPSYMVDMWNAEHEEYIERVAKIKFMLDVLK